MPPDHRLDPLLDELHKLPAITPPRALTERVARAALTALEDGNSAEKPGFFTLPAPGFRAYLEFALYRAAVPSALAGATIIYLSWAINAASHLY